jgi:hypothetical protein
MIKHLVLMGAVAAGVFNGGCSNRAVTPAVESSQPQVSPTNPANVRPAASRASPANPFPLDHSAPGATWATTPEMSSGFGAPGSNR